MNIKIALNIQRDIQKWKMERPTVLLFDKQSDHKIVCSLNWP